LFEEGAQNFCIKTCPVSALFAPFLRGAKTNIARQFFRPWRLKKNPEIKFSRRLVEFLAGVRRFDEGREENPARRVITVARILTLPQKARELPLN
jgi:hypothetical protein